MPILPNGWVLLGDLSKFVPVSPQRFVEQTAEFAADFSFLVIGADAEIVSVSLVARFCQRIL